MTLFSGVSQVSRLRSGAWSDLLCVILKLNTQQCVSLQSVLSALGDECGLIVYRETLDHLLVQIDAYSYLTHNSNEVFSFEISGPSLIRPALTVF